MGSGWAHPLASISSHRKVTAGGRPELVSMGPEQRPICLGLRVIHPAVWFPNPYAKPYFTFQFLLPQSPSAYSPTAPFLSCIRIPSSYFWVIPNLTLKLVLHKKRRYYIFFEVYRTWIFICHIKMSWQINVIFVTYGYWKMTFWIH